MSAEALIALLMGVIGTLASVVAYFWKLHQADDAKRELERDRREQALAAEAEAWQGRWEASDARLGRIANAFTAALGKPAPE